MMHCYTEWSTHISSVTGPSNRDKAAYRTKMKDCLILLQALLLAVFIGAVLLRNQTLVRNKMRNLRHALVDCTVVCTHNTTE